MVVSVKVRCAGECAGEYGGECAGEYGSECEGEVCWGV